jgi:FkbM family methyltransferase
MHEAWRQLADDGMALLLRCDSDSALQYCTAGAPSFSFGNADARALIVCKSKRRLDQFAQHMNAFYRRMEALGPTVANYEERVRDFLVQTIKPGWTVVDVGSHVGAHTITMAQLVTNTGRVIAFDAHPQNVSDLRLNGVTFGIDSWLTAEWNAVTDGSTPSVTLYEGRNKWSAEWNLRGFDVCGVKTAPAMDVAAISLDGYFGKQHIDLVKIDVEGAGTGVIRGMAGILATTRPMILLEYHGEDEREVLSALVAARYTLRDVDTGAFVTPETATYHMVCTPQRI